MENNDENKIEAVLFMFGESVSLEQLAIAIESDKEYTITVINRLIEKYKTEYKNSGVKVIKIGNRYRMVTNNVYYENCKKINKQPVKPIIDDSLLLTLTIIAYKQPVTRPEIDEIRGGISSEYSINKLLQYGLIEEKGRLDTAGRPKTYGTTEEFLLRFGLESLEKLPRIDFMKSAELESKIEAEISSWCNNLGITPTFKEIYKKIEL